MSIESVAAELRALRARLDARDLNTHTWPTKDEEHAADLDRYDRRLLKAAAILGVRTPAPQRREPFLLGEHDRRRLELRLAEEGVDVRASDGSPR